MKNKYIFKLSFFFVALLFLVSCQDVSDDIVSTKDYQEDMVALTNMGFDISNVKDLGDSYLINGCVAINKKDLVVTRQMSTGFVVKSPGNIKIFVKSNVPDVWKKGTKEAIAEFNKIENTSLRFSEVTSESEADLVVSYLSTKDVPNNVIAWADFPSSTGLVGRNVYVNSSYIYTTSESNAKYNMAHEIGHAIGFRHTNLVARGETGGSHISGTEQVDNLSVFNGGTANYSWGGFSSNDIIAIQTLYPVIVDNSEGVIFYEHHYFGGAFTSLIPKGRHTLAALQQYGFKNDWASSFIIKGNVKVTVYEHDNFLGWNGFSYQSMYQLGAPYNDAISSVVVE